MKPAWAYGRMSGACHLHAYPGSLNGSMQSQVTRFACGVMIKVWRALCFFQKEKDILPVNGTVKAGHMPGACDGQPLHH